MLGMRRREFVSAARRRGGRLAARGARRMDDGKDNPAQGQAGLEDVNEMSGGLPTLHLSLGSFTRANTPPI